MSCSLLRRTVWAGLLLLATVSCRSTPPVLRPTCPIPDWDVAGAEVKRWSATDPDFEQNRALEGSGLTAAGYTLYATSEKYHRLLRIDARTLKAEVFDLDVPKYSELEGVTLMGGDAVLCDEAHASVIAVDLESMVAGEMIATELLPLQGIEVSGGKLGLEGITALDDGSERLFLLLERSGDESSGCRSTVFPMRRIEGRLDVDGAPLYIALEDCNWRLTGLQWWEGWLLALRTRYPGERYEIITIDTKTGEVAKILELTDLLVGVREAGWGNNVEGLTVTPDGALWLLSDNAMTDVIDRAAPPVAERSTLLMRIPALGFVCRE